MKLLDWVRVPLLQKLRNLIMRFVSFSRLVYFFFYFYVLKPYNDESQQRSVKCNCLYICDHKLSFTVLIFRYMGHNRGGEEAPSALSHAFIELKHLRSVAWSCCQILEKGNFFFFFFFMFSVFYFFNISYTIKWVKHIVFGLLVNPEFRVDSPSWT